VSGHYGVVTPSEMKEETTNILRALDVGALTILGAFSPANRKSRFADCDVIKMIMATRKKFNF
jgi:hypothetical protein